MKKINWKDPFIKTALLVFLVIAALMVFYNILGTVGEVLLRIRSFISTLTAAASAIIIGIIIAFILQPYVNLLDDKLISRVIKKNRNLSRGVSIGFVYVVVLGFIALLIALIAPVLVNNIKDLINTAPRYIDMIVRFVNDELMENSLFQYADVISAINSFMAEAQSNITSLVTGFLSNTVRFLTSLSTGMINVIFGFLVAVYVLMEGKRLGSSSRRLSIAVFGERRTDKIVREVGIATKIFRKFFNGRLVESFISAVLILICFLIIGVKYSPLISVLTFITNLIPYFGPIIGGVLTFILVAVENPSQLLLAMILLLAVSVVDSWIISPKILGDVVGLSPFWVLLGALVGGGLFGFWGMMIGIPTASVIHFAVKRWIDYRITKRSSQKNAGSSSGGVILTDLTDIDTKK
ncbi:MAG: AI-2E family transporter [Christensenellales bacterium]